MTYHWKPFIFINLDGNSIFELSRIFYLKLLIFPCLSLIRTFASKSLTLAPLSIVPLSIVFVVISVTLCWNSPYRAPSNILIPINPWRHIWTALYLIHLFVIHLDPLRTGHPPWKVSRSKLPLRSILYLKKKNPIGYPSLE